MMSHTPVLPQYLCHKRIRAAKICSIDPVDYSNSIRLSLELPGDRRDYVVKDQEWINRFRPIKGGYYVQYEDGYTSFSPAAAFEEGYSLIPEPRPISVKELETLMQDANQTANLIVRATSLDEALDVLSVAMTGVDIDAVHRNGQKK